MGGGGFMPSLTGGASRSGDASSSSGQSAGNWNVNLGGSGYGSGAGNPGGGIPETVMWIGVGLAVWVIFRKK